MEVLRLILFCQKQQKLLLISAVTYLHNAVSTKRPSNYNGRVRCSMKFKR